MPTEAPARIRNGRTTSLVSMIASDLQTQDSRFTKHFSSDLYTLACTVIADVSSLALSLEPEIMEDGKKVFKFEFDVELLFGKTEFEARICWQQDVGVAL